MLDWVKVSIVWTERGRVIVLELVSVVNPMKEWKMNRVCAFLILVSMAGSAAAEQADSGPTTKPSVITQAVKVRRSIEPVDLRLGPQLFIDDYLIAESKSIDKVTQHPQRFLDQPILGWEQSVGQPYHTVLKDPQTGKFRMWYNHGSGENTAIAYAESDDGVRWTTPQLNIMGADNRLFKIGRSKEHGSFGVSVIDDGPAASDPQRRFKLMWWSGLSEPAGVSIAWSADGIHWTQYEKNPVLPHYGPDHPQAAIGTGDIVDLFYDPIRERYSTLVKLHAQETDGWTAAPRAKRAFRRLVGQSVSEDFLNWETPWRVMTPEPRDEGQLEFYGSSAPIARGPLLISFVRVLHDDYSPQPGMVDDKGVPTGTGYTALATSRDGERWERHDGIFLDRNPQPDTWDRAMTWVGSAVPVGEELYLYYGGYKRGHKVEPNKERQLGLVKMPMDRFVARESSGDNPGTLVTAPLQVRAGKGSQFVLNADASKGRIRVQVRDVKGDVIPGFSFADNAPVTGDGPVLPVQWTINVNNEMKPGLIDLYRLHDQTIRLEFEITNARLFGFDLQQGEPRPLRLSAGPHLFIDDHLIQEDRDLDRVTQAPQRLDEPIMGLKTHGDARVSPGTILYDAGRDVFRLWYWTAGKNVKNALRYMESKDPAKWPPIDAGEPLLELAGDQGKVILDDRPDVDPQRRYKLGAFPEKPLIGPGVYFSPDGKKWTAYEGNPVLPYYPPGHASWPHTAGDIVDPYWDPIRRQFGMLIKMFTTSDKEFGINSRTGFPGMGLRLTGVSVSDDFVRWSQPRRAFEPDYRDTGAFEHYGGDVMARGDLLIAFMLVLRDDLGEEGRGYTVLATSRDGHTWTRDRQPFLDANPNAEFDRVMAWAKTVTTKGDTVYMIYSGRDKGHKTGSRQVGLAWLKRDRYVARQNEPGKKGTLRTPLLSYTGGVPAGLWLNADASKGSVVVRVLNVKGQPLAGIESQPLKKDGLSLPVEWSKPLSAIGDEPFQLEFVLDNAAIYGFSFKADEK